MNCGDCGTPVELKVMREPGERRRPFLVDADGSGMRRHWCPPPGLDSETYDVCSCGRAYVRINRGERLNLDRKTPHVCVPAKPEKPSRMPDPPRQVSVDPPPVKPFPGLPIPRLGQ